MKILKFFKRLERWEYYHPSSFWACMLIGYFGFTILFNRQLSFSKNSFQSQIVIEEIRGGRQEQKPQNLRRHTYTPKSPASMGAQKPKPARSSGEKITFKQPSGNPSGSENGDFDDEIGTKKWEDWVCPKPDEIISHSGFWDDLANDPDVCTDDDYCEEKESEDQEIEEETSIERFPRRRLLAEPAPTPTGKLDAENLEKFDFTNKKLKPIEFPSREGIRLSMDHRSLRKVVYSHPSELGLSDLGSRIPCPLQVDLNKWQRQDCWAITDTNIREAVIKILERTTFTNPRIVTLERFPPNCSTQRATYFVDIVTGDAIYFRIGGKQDGKLWSADNFERTEIIDMMTDPNVKKITDISDYNFNF